MKVSHRSRTVRAIGPVLLIAGILWGGRPAFASGRDGVGLGLALPQGVSAANVAGLIAPGEDPLLITLVGMQKWPHRPDSYIGIVCLAPDKDDYKTDMEYSQGKPCCFAGYGGFNQAQKPSRVFIGLIEYKSELKLVASYGKPLDVVTSWKDSEIEPTAVERSDETLPGSYDWFDLAKYKIADDRIAFGIRVSWQTAYAGGGGMFRALMLFMVDGDKLINVFCQPMQEWGMSNGEYHEDGTRDKNEWETKNILKMLPQKHFGYYDLRLREAGGRWNKTFRWDKDARRYLPVGK